MIGRVALQHRPKPDAHFLNTLTQDHAVQVQAHAISLCFPAMKVC
jgi:hypothetical protein